MIRTRGSRIRVLTPVGEGAADQSFKTETNINHIMDKYQRTGLVSHVSRYQGRYEDFADAPDYHTALNKMKDAEAMFMTLPARVREQFFNDPGEFLEFVMDPKNESEMREMGLLPREAPQAPGRNDQEEQPASRKKADEPKPPQSGGETA